MPVALYLGTVGRTQRDRDEVERRFQNPVGGPAIVEHRPGRQALLLGLWEDDALIDVTRPLLVSADPLGRQGKTTRYSVFVSVDNLQTALRRGWSEATNGEGELVRCFAPELLPANYAATTSGATPPSYAMQAAIEGSGLLDADQGDLAAAGQRARRAASALVRDARFTRRVLDAYDGRCAMCGLGAGLVQAAHIYPASAPGSRDEPWNGLALCANHHLAFDRHLVAVDADTGRIAFSNQLLDQAANPAARALIDSTFDDLAAPQDRAATPRPEMFRQRYQLSPERYEWL